jgi:thiol:disulfide interchange protein DsbC
MLKYSGAGMVRRRPVSTSWFWRKGVTPASFPVSASGTAVNERRSGLLKGILLASLMLAWLLVLVPNAPAEDTLDLSKAIKVGSGPTMVIEFTDPDCPFCRQAELYFRNKPGVTRYIFLIPLPIHPESKGKIQYILSAKDKAKAYQEVQGNFDPRKLAAETTPEGIKLQKEHQEIARLNKMTSTPTFMIYGRIIEGFDLKRLEPLLK